MNAQVKFLFRLHSTPFPFCCVCIKKRSCNVSFVQLRCCFVAFAFRFVVFAFHCVAFRGVCVAFALHLHSRNTHVAFLLFSHVAVLLHLHSVSFCLCFVVELSMAFKFLTFKLRVWLLTVHRAAERRTSAL